MGPSCGWGGAIYEWGWGHPVGGVGPSMSGGGLFCVLLMRCIIVGVCAVRVCIQ